MSKRDDLINHLAANPGRHTVRDLSRDLRVSETYVQNTLKELGRDGAWRVESAGRGRATIWTVEVEMPRLTPGTQVVRLPPHARGDIDHPDCEAGFVTSVRPKEGVAFCRYWSQAEPGQLRTKANSERTPLDNLVVRITRPQAMVEAMLAAILEADNESTAN